MIDPWDGITDPYRWTVERRIAELWKYRQWWRTNRWADWPQVRHDLEVELRCLIGIARQARAMSRVESRGDHFRFPAGVGR
jgi:hypothetical protein